MDNEERRQEVHDVLHRNTQSLPNGKERRHRLDEHLKERRPDVYELVISLRDNKKKEE